MARIHIIGAGGDGMSALALLYLARGHRVSGSDVAQNEKTALLAARGARIATGHDAAHVAGADLVVHSPAIPRSNPELVAARAAGTPILARTRALTGLLDGRSVAAVAGSHGKTTTTAMLATILRAAGLDPGHMAGGTTPSLGAGAAWGTGTLFVAEACEAFRALDAWHPAHLLVTNVDDEHSDHYGGLEGLRAAFADLADRIPADGALVLSGDDGFLARLAAGTGGRATTYGFRPDNRFTATDVSLDPAGSAFTATRDRTPLARITLTVPGRHNVSNALGAFAMALALGVDAGTAAAALAGYRAVGRRWQLIGEERGVRVYEDFAHHPTEIAATLATARLAAGEGRVAAVVQPQLTSRVSRLANAYAVALDRADRVFVLPVDPGGEAGDVAAAEAELARALAARGATFVPVTADESDAATIAAALEAGDVAVAMGPSGAPKLALMIAAQLAAGPAGEAPAVAAPPAAEGLLHAAFERRAAEAPEAVALIDGDATWTYRHLDGEANRFAAALRARGVVPDDLVVLHMEKSARLVALMLGVLKAGAAFAPVDPRMIRPGMDAVLAKAGAVLTVSDHPAGAASLGLPAPLTAAGLLAGAPAGPAAEPAHATPASLAYAIFTSGSTGLPRLVGVEHRHAAPVIAHGVARVYEAADFRLVPTVASISFDASIFQILAPLSAGGTLLVVSDLAALSRSPRLGAVTMMGLTPSMARAFLATTALPASLRTLVLGGEATPEDLLARLRAVPTLRRIRNVYGPAEATLFALTALLLDRDATRPVPPGGGTTLREPVGGVAIRLVGDDGRDVADGEAGEIVIESRTISRGYLGDPEATAARFGVLPDGRRSYRTGDLALRRADGAYEFLGRNDDQVKVNGARVELGEVEAHLRACPGVRNCAVLKVAAPDGRGILAGFVVLDGKTDAAFVRLFLRRHVAALLVPQRIVALPALPMQVNGKVDRQALAGLLKAEEAVPRPAAPVPSAPAGDVAARVLAVWRQVLKRPDLESHDDFFAAGGDSLAAMDLVLSVERALGVRLTSIDFDGLSSAGAMAERIRAERGADGALPEQTDMTDPAAILARQRVFLAAWRGRRLRPDSLVVSRNAKARQPGLFWVFQGFREFRALAGALRIPLHGMRSGHRVMTYTPATIALLAETYADEIAAIQPKGPIRIGGNCQGATIARATAFALRARGRRVERLILLDAARPWRYDEPVDLIFRRGGRLDPYRDGTDRTAAFAETYPAGFTVALTDGPYNGLFRPAHVGGLAGILRSVLDRDRPAWRGLVAWLRETLP